MMRTLCRAVGHVGAGNWLWVNAICKEWAGGWRCSLAWLWLLFVHSVRQLSVAWSTVVVLHVTHHQTAYCLLSTSVDMVAGLCMPAQLWRVVLQVLCISFEAALLPQRCISDALVIPCTPLRCGSWRSLEANQHLASTALQWAQFGCLGGVMAGRRTPG